MVQLSHILVQQSIINIKVWFIMLTHSFCWTEVEVLVLAMLFLQIHATFLVTNLHGNEYFSGNADTAFNYMLFYGQHFYYSAGILHLFSELRSNIIKFSSVGNRWLSFVLFITFIIPEIHPIIHHIFNHWSQWRKSSDLNNLHATSTANCSFILSLRNLIPTLKCYTSFNF